MKRPAFLRSVAAACLASALLAARAAPAEPPSVPRFSHPGAGQVFYFVLTDRFANGSAANDTGGIAGGSERDGFDPALINRYHGGDLAGLTAKLDYIKGLGATAVWITPPFRNKTLQGDTAAYHGYWILDFLHVDPHLGTDAELRTFADRAHALGIKVYLDIVINHTADVIQYRGGRREYVPKADAPYRDASGRPFDEQAAAFNGIEPAPAFPSLSAERSFAYVPWVPEDEAGSKNPAWLNNPVYYHNRGDSTFEGESSLQGDFGGLDDVFTEHPDVVRGFIGVYRHWIEEFGIDGFRIDTVRHVNLGFWEAFGPAIREAARHAGRPAFLQFGESAGQPADIPLLSEFSTTACLDATLDFGFFDAATNYVSKGGSAAVLGDFFAQDDWYTGPNSSAHTETTFLGNHDAGRFPRFLKRDNPDASPEQLARLVEFGHGLLLLARGQPVLYYGDEQGMMGLGSRDVESREDMFPSQAPEYRGAALLATTRTGADDKFDTGHPFYRLFHGLAALRTANPALSRGAMILRPAAYPSVFAFSRVDRVGRVEFLAAFNNSRTAAATAVLQTSQPAGARLGRVFASWGQDEPAAANGGLVADAQGRVTVELPPLSFALWRAESALPAPASRPRVALAAPASGALLKFATREAGGHLIPVRQEIRAEVSGGDGVTEVTFLLARASRPSQFELLGTDDAPPYRVFWRPPPDLEPGDALSFIAVVDDLRGGRAVARADAITVEPPPAAFGIRGAAVPRLASAPGPKLIAIAGRPLVLAVEAAGTSPLEFQWLHNRAEVPGATGPTLAIPRVSGADAGRYCVVVRNRAGAAVSEETFVRLAGEAAAPDSR